MYYNLSARVTIGNLRWPGASEIEITSSAGMLTDTCTLTLPRNAKFRGKAATEYISRGDSVTVEIGVNNEYRTEFTGFGRSIVPGVPLVLECEDHAYLLKKKTYNTVLEEAKLSDIIGLVWDGPVELESNPSVGTWEIENSTGAMILDQLQKDYFITSYFRNGILHSGFKYRLNDVQTYEINLDRVKDAKSLEWIDQPEPIQFEGVSIQPDGEKIKHVVGDPGGEKRTLTYGPMGKAELRDTLEKVHRKHSFANWRGALKTFGFHAPFEHGDILRVYSPRHPERNKSFLVSKVVKRYGSVYWEREAEFAEAI